MSKSTKSLRSLVPDNVTAIEEAVRDFQDLDGSVKLTVLKAIKKVSTNPKPNTEGGYGKPLGHHSSSDLSGYLKIKIKSIGYRIVYKYIRDNDGMHIIIISIRDEEKVYKEAESRIRGANI